MCVNMSVCLQPLIQHSLYLDDKKTVVPFGFQLALSKCRNTVIGQPGRIKGLSGGEMKRLSFASEVLTDPPLMFCDEPTSGLDSFMAHQVVSVLKTLAGKLGAACPSNYNPADYFVQMLAVVPGEEISCRHAINTVCDAFQKSEHGIKIALEAEAINGEFEDSLRDSKYSKNRSLYKASWCEQFRAVLWRSWLSVIKEPILIKVRLLQTVMVSLLVGIVYFNQRLDQDGVMNINGALFIFLTNMTFQNVFAVINEHFWTDIVSAVAVAVAVAVSRHNLAQMVPFFNGQARMKLNGNMRVLDIGRKIDDLLKDVGLTSRRDVRIGSGIDDKVLSGDPKILFLDEPTTGQDSHSANCLIAQLKSFAAKGRTVLCTIHQPSSVIFSSFDRIILIAEGRVAFAGRIDQAVEFFASQGYECPRKYNPADFLVAIVATGSKNENGEEVAHNICDVFSTSKISNEIDRILEKQIESVGASKKKKDLPFPAVRLTFVYVDTYSKRLMLRQQIVEQSVAAIAGLCFVGAVNFDQLGIQATQGVLFILVSENAFFPMYATLALIPQELPLLRREYRAGMYPVHLYYTARILSLARDTISLNKSNASVAQIPGLIIEPILFATIVYWLAGLRDDAETFGLTLLVLLLTINVSTACGCFFSTAFESVPLAMAYLIPFDYILMITMGPFLKLGYLKCYACETTDSELPCITEGIDVLHRYDFDETNFWIDMLSMVNFSILSAKINVNS
ncbi:hypothetical protein E2986_13333 [Frieseomelitta varia]|uniref:Uncharacterized protein n=1 Tax=Frieseomelitta varia TaxID=561572 RepID=A0A833RR46_9HYME|nr:hypothetical protein E2986_13333 [Frieseomelitta varia]